MTTLKRAIKRKLSALSPVDYSGIPLLVYHSVGSDCPASLSAVRFAEQVQFLRSEFKFGTASQVTAEAMSSGRRIALTFDDGFRDTYEVAVQVLATWNLPFTLFVATGFIDGSADLNWSPHYRGLPPLSWPQIKELHCHGVEIGAHTVTHPKLATCSPEAIRVELSQSRRLLEDKIAAPVTALAYPFGQLHDISETVLTIVEECGYDRAYTTVPDLARPGDPPFLIPRITVDNVDEIQDLRQKVEGRRTYMRNVSRVASVLAGLGLRQTTSNLRNRPD